MDISIIIPYNIDRGYLKESTLSAFDQKFTGTFEVIPQHGFCRTSKNINDGIKKANGKYIKILAEDDLLTPNCLQDLFEEAEKGFDLVCANAINFNSETSYTFYQSIIPATISELAQQNLIHGGTVLYRKSMLMDIGLYNEDLWTAEEFELYLRLADKGYKFGYVDSIVYKYRLHDSMKSLQNGINTLEQSKKYIMRKRYIREEIQMKYINNHKTIIR